MIQRKRTSTSSGTRAPPTRRRKTTAAPTRMRFQIPPQLALRGRPAMTEVKSMDINLANANMVAIAGVAGTEPAAAYTGLTEINCVRQDGTVSGRIGNKIVIKSIHLKFITAQAATAMNAFRFMVVYDRQPNGAFPGPTDILLDQPLGAANSLGGLNIANKSRFSVIRDQIHTADPGAGSTKIFSMYMKGRWETEFGSNIGTIADFKTGAIYFICFYNYSAVSVPVLTTPCCRIRYFD
nr:MAG: putative capsid protein [Arizlama virus]